MTAMATIASLSADAGTSAGQQAAEGGGAESAVQSAAAASPASVPVFGEGEHEQRHGDQS